MAKKIIDLLMKVPAIEFKPLFLKLKGIKRAYLMAALAALAVPAVFMTYGFVHMIGTSKIYCLNCHVNQRNMGFWKNSAVHPEVSCSGCHDVDGKGVMEAAFHFSFSAKDEVVSGHCMGCHKDLDREVGFDARIKNRPLNELIRIPHAKHIKELGIKCTYCHGNIYHERQTGKFATYRPAMQTCYTCHDEEKTACDSCHPAGLPSAASMDGKVGGGKLIYEPSGAGEVVFSHKDHMDKGFKCADCHDELFKMRRTGSITMTRIYDGHDCGRCHNGTIAFASEQCPGCHRGAKKDGGTISYPGGGTGKVTFSHANHIGMGLKCRECHIKLFNYKRTSGNMKMDEMNKGRFCGGCHNGKRAFAVDDCGKCHAMN